MGCWAEIPLPSPVCFPQRSPTEPLLEPSGCQSRVSGCPTVLAVPPAVTSQLPGAAPWVHKNLPLKVLPTLSCNKATFSHREMNKQGKKTQNIPEQLVWHCWASSSPGQGHPCPCARWHQLCQVSPAWAWLGWAGGASPSLAPSVPSGWKHPKLGTPNLGNPHFKLQPGPVEDKMRFKVPSSPNHSMIIYSYFLRDFWEGSVLDAGLEASTQSLPFLRCWPFLQDERESSAFFSLFKGVKLAGKELIYVRFLRGKELAGK